MRPIAAAIGFDPAGDKQRRTVTLGSSRYRRDYGTNGVQRAWMARPVCRQTLNSVGAAFLLVNSGAQRSIDQMTDATKDIPQRFFHPRAESCVLLGGVSGPTFQRFVDSGRLTAVRLSGRRRGMVYFEAGELLRLRDELVAEAKAAAAKIKVRRLKLP
jgi:hypothetical protein